MPEVGRLNTSQVRRVARLFQLRGERIRYYPGGTTATYRELVAIVLRDPDTAPRTEDSRIKSWRCTILLRNDATLGITTHSPKDLADVPLKHNGPAERVRVAVPVEVDFGVWTLECHG